MIFKTKNKEYRIHVTSTGCTLLDCRAKSFLPEIFKSYDWITIATSWQQGEEAIKHFTSVIESYENIGEKT